MSANRLISAAIFLFDDFDGQKFGALNTLKQGRNALSKLILLLREFESVIHIFRIVSLLAHDYKKKGIFVFPISV